MDIAQLAYSVDSKDLVRGAANMDKLGKAAGRAENATDRLEKQWKRMGKTLGIGLAALGGTAFALYIKNTIEAEKVQAQLASRIKDTGGAAMRSLKQLNAMADELQGLTVFDDEAIGDAQAMLLTFKNISGINFDAATEGTLDLATAMKTDATAAALQLGKALNDPILGVTALGRAGIQFSQSQKAVIQSLIETGDVAGAQRIILKELEGKMGTAAEAARDTLGGALQALGNSFDNLLEGDSGDAGLKGARQAVEDLNTTLNDPGVKRGFDTLIQGAITAAATMVKFAADTAGAMKFLAEAAAAKIHGPDLTDLVRSGDEIERVSKRIAALRKEASVGGGGGRDGGSPSSAFFSNPDPAFIRDAQQRKGVLGAAFYAGSQSDELKFLEQYKAEREKGMKLLEEMRNMKAPEAAALAITPPTIDYPTGDPASSKGSSGKSSAARQAEEAAQAMREASEAQAGWHERILDMTADLGGPTAQVMRDYDKSMQELNGQFNEGKVRLGDYATAQELLTQIRDKDLAAINARKTPAEEMLETLRLETEGLYISNDQLEIRQNLLAAGVTAESTWGKEISESTRLLQEQREAMGDQIEVMDSIRDAGKGMLVDFGNGVKPIDAIGDALDRVYQKMLQMASEKLMDQIFGKSGDPAGGSSGGFDWAGLIGSIAGAFGGGGGGDYTGASTAGGDFGAFNPNVSGFAKAGISAAQTNEKGPERIQQREMHIPPKVQERPSFQVISCPR